MQSENLYKSHWLEVHLWVCERGSCLEVVQKFWDCKWKPVADMNTTNFLLWAKDGSMSSTSTVWRFAYIGSMCVSFRLEARETPLSKHAATQRTCTSTFIAKTGGRICSKVKHCNWWWDIHTETWRGGGGLFNFEKELNIYMADQSIDWLKRHMMKLI